MALPAALHGEAAKTSGRADEMLEDRRRNQQEHHPQAASSQGTARNRRACRAGRVRVRLSRPNQQAPIPNSSAAASLPPSDICAGIRLPSKAMKNTSALGLNRLVATRAARAPGATAAAPVEPARLAVAAPQPGAQRADAEPGQVQRAERLQDGEQHRRTAEQQRHAGQHQGGMQENPAGQPQRAGQGRPAAPGAGTCAPPGRHRDRG